MRAWLLLGIAVVSARAEAQVDEDEGGGPVEGSATVSPPKSASVKDAPNASHIVEKGDTLWDLSQKYLGSPWYWPKVWSYNPDIANPHWIYPGNNIRFYGADEQPSQVEVGQVPDVEEGTMVDEGGGISKSGEIGVRPKNSVSLSIQSFVTTKELEQAAKVAGSFAENELLTFPYTVYVDVSGKKTLKVGETAVVFREGGEVVHPVTNAFFGYMTRVLAEGKVIALDTKRNMATLQITRSIDEVHRGDSVSPTGESMLRTIAPRPNEKVIKGATIVRGAARYVVFQSEQMVVILDKGADDGVKLGNTFTFVRSGDSSPLDHHFNPQKNDDAFPEETVGFCMVVDVKSKASSCVIQRSLRELMPGDRAEMKMTAPRTAAR